VRSPLTSGMAGMMGKAGPYGYDPFAPGQAWDPHAATTSLHVMCRGLVDAWLRQCASAPGSDSLSALQVSEAQVGVKPAPAGVLDMAQEWRRAELGAAQPQQMQTVPTAPKLWPFGPSVNTKAVPAGPHRYDNAYLGQEPHQLPEGELCKRMLDEYIYKCDFSLM